MVVGKQIIMISVSLTVNRVPIDDSTILQKKKREIQIEVLTNMHKGCVMAQGKKPKAKSIEDVDHACNSGILSKRNKPLT